MFKSETSMVIVVTLVTMLVVRLVSANCDLPTYFVRRFSYASVLSFKNACGYYRVHFIDPVTGKKSCGKSTHSKDRTEATVIATKWISDGVPEFRADSRAFKADVCGEKLPEIKIKNNSATMQQTQNLQSFVDSLSQNDINTLIVMLAQKVQGGVMPAVQVVQPTMPVQTVIQNVVEVASENTNVCSADVPQKERIPFVSYMIDFWDFEKSKYLAEEKAYGRQISERHAKEMRGLAVRYWKPYFGEERFVDEISKNELEEFFMYLRNERGLSGATVNHTMSCASRVFTYLSKKELIAKNPFDNLSRFSLDKIKRGIPTETEVAKLMNLRWKNDTAKAAFCLGAFAGLRAGEISGLRTCDLDFDADIVHVRHTWNDTDGLKSTKNTDTRDIPVDHETMTELMLIAKSNKHYSDLSYVFWSTSKPEQPFNPSWYQDGFYEALAEIGISEEQRKERVIVFHSLRHFCATLLRQRADLTTVQTILGHRTEEMTEHYSSHMSESQAAMMKSVMSENKKHILKFLAA